MTVYENFVNNTPATWRYKWPSGGEGSESGVGLIHARQRTGVRRAKPSVLDPTEYFLRDHKLVRPRGVATVKAVGYPTGTEYSGTMVGFSIEQIVQEYRMMKEDWDDNLENIALTSAMAKMDHKDLDLGTAWAERGKTAELVTKTAMKGVDALRDIRRKDGRGLLRTLGLSQEGARGKGVVDTYLAYHYGMKPLLQDVAGSVKALTRLPPDSWAIRARGSSDAMYRHKSLMYHGGMALAARIQAFKGCHVTITARRRDLSRAEDIAWALGLDNGLGTLWELTPFSFVKDWMVPVGDYLAAMNSLKYYTGYQVVRSQKYTRTSSFGPGRLVTGGADHDCHLIGNEQLTRLDRRVSSGPPMPGIPVKNPVSLDHTAKALALLASLSSSKLPRHIRY